MVMMVMEIMIVVMTKGREIVVVMIPVVVAPVMAKRQLHRRGKRQRHHTSKQLTFTPYDHYRSFLIK
jgi:hypothetical protein